MKNNKRILKNKIIIFLIQLLKKIIQKLFLKKYVAFISLFRYSTLNVVLQVVNQKRSNKQKLRGKKTWKIHKAWKNRSGINISPLAFGLSYEEYNYQKNTKFNKNIKFSILVPLYNTPKRFLEEMIGSVIFQSYENWELCLTDGSDKNHSYVEETCIEISKKDKRIKYEKLDKNNGISENTNECIKMATGEFISLLDHDDILHPSALFETMKAICDKDADFIYTDEATFESPDLHKIIQTNFKPDFAPDYFNSLNYICHFTSFSKELLKKIGAFDSDCDGAQDYDMFLRLTEIAHNIVHIKKCLYFWRASSNSTAGSTNAKTYTNNAGKRALEKHFARLGISANVDYTGIPNTYRIKYPIQGNPLISILIPNYDHILSLEKCINSIQNISTYTNYEIIIIENNSKQKETFTYYESLKYNSQIKIVKWSGKFNYSAINNYGFNFARGDYIILLNNDVEIITPNWIEEMLMFAQRNDVGAVGAMLYYPNNSIQHGGVILGVGGVAGHSHKFFPRGNYGYVRRLITVQNYLCVTAACLMVSSKIYKEVNGLDEEFEVAFNDVDFCLKITKAGYFNVWTPFAELYHYESISRGLEDTPEKQKRFKNEVLRFQTKWKNELFKGDPFYNPNLTLSSQSFSVKKNTIFCWKD